MTIFVLAVIVNVHMVDPEQQTRTSSAATADMPAECAHRKPE